MKRSFLVCLLTLLSVCTAGAKDRVPPIKEIVIPREIFTGEVFTTAEEYQKVADSIVLLPRGVRLSKQQFSNLISLLSALDAVAKSANIEAIYLSTQSDAFLSAKVTLSEKRGWAEFEKSSAKDHDLVEVAALVRFANDGKK